MILTRKEKYIIKKCTVCKELKEETYYYNSTNAKDGKQPRCKECDSKARKKYYELNEKSLEKRTERGKRYKYKKYGITPEEYRILNESQKECCAICNSKETRSTSTELSVDHCHTTGKIRGLLCNNCNRGLGMLGDSVESISRALVYLTSHYNKDMGDIS